ncbi:MAG: tetratricopeptide repeat protein [Candidatus Omnitrophota bacterium]
MNQRKYILMLCCVPVVFTAGDASAQEIENKNNALADTQKSQDNPCMHADALIRKGQTAEAKALLEQFIRTLPSDWKPLYEKNGKDMIICWNSQEFIAYAQYRGKTDKSKDAIWPTAPSYSQAFYLLGFIAAENKDFSSAIPYFDKALSLEPDHPTIWCEKAFVVRQMGHNEEAYQLYLKALEIRPWATDHQRAVALRGAGFTLTELGRLAEAETLYERSLDLEPGNNVALNELSYIRHRKRGGAAGTTEMIPIGTNATAK